MVPRYFEFARCRRCFSDNLDATNSRAGRVFWGLRVVLFGLKYGSMCEISVPVGALEQLHSCFNWDQSLVAGWW
jgi:hypothetical protein